MRTKFKFSTALIPKRTIKPRWLIGV